MNSFEELFLKSKGHPVVYNGQQVVLLDRIPAKNESAWRLTFECFGSTWRQGVILRVDGSFEINGQSIKKSLVLWQDTAPKEVSFRVKTRKGHIEINNVWDTGDGCIQSWHNGAAIIVEAIPNGRLYHCNDGKPDDDFCDLVFRLESM